MSAPAGRLRVMTFVGTRPEIIRLSRVIARLDEHCEHTLVHTGQNYDYELNGIFFEDLGLRPPDRYLEAAGSSAAETIGRVIMKADEVLAERPPEAVLVLGDTNSCLAVIAAKRRRIPVFHMEAGNRAFDARTPEEINRRIVDHTADINLTYSTIARDHLLAEGLPPDRVIKTGSPMKEVLDHYAPRIRASDVLVRLGLEPGGYFLVSVHREENVDPEPRRRAFAGILNALAARFDRPVIVSTHPRTRRRLEEGGHRLDPRVRTLKPLAFSEYVALQKSARAVLSDSGTISEEASILGLRALNLRDSHERPEAMEEGTVLLVGMNPERVFQGLRILEDQPPPGAPGAPRLVADYDVSNVSEKVLRILHSYVDYVHRVVWFRS